MLKLLFSNHLSLVLAQALVAAIAAMVVVLLAHRRGIHLESETLVAMLRGIIQITAVGSILLIAAACAPLDQHLPACRDDYRRRSNFSPPG